MHKVLIVDDEKGIRYLLQHIIEWEKNNLTLVGMAADGFKALEMIRKEKPEIVIVDVQMNGMTGLELISELRNSSSDIHFIVISGYQYFDYAKTAIKYGVEDYLVKPINQKELNGVLHRIVEKIETEKTNRVSDEQYRDYVQGKTQMFLQALYHGETLRSIEDIRNNYAMENFQPTNCFIVLAIDCDEALLPLAQRIFPQIEGVIIAIAEGDGLHAYCFSPEGNTMLVLLSTDDADERPIDRCVEKLFLYMKKSVYPYKEMSVTIGKGRVAFNCPDLNFALESANKAAESRIWLGVNRVVNASDIDLDCLANFIISDENGSFDRAIDLLDRAGVEKVFESQITAARDYLNKYPYMLRSVLFDLYSKCKYAIEQIHGYRTMPSRERLEKSMRHASCKEEVIALCVAPALDAIDVICKEKSTAYSEVVRRTQEYLDDHYSENISIREIARILFYNPVYLGSLFHKETGVTLHDYLLKLRIQNAAKLLKSTDLSVKQVSEKVGYKDTRHFNRLFKEEIGISPADYKRIHTSGALRENND